MWQDLFAAVALVLVLEGMLPFLNPQQFRKTLVMASQLDDKTLRTIGCFSMAIGVVVLYLVRSS